MIRTEDEHRVRQIALGAGLLVLLTLGICGLLVGWGYLPGVLGEWVGMMVGVATSPFLLEATCLILGLMLVVAINGWRRNRDGDELVYLERIEGADVPGDLPEHAKWAVFREKPLEGESPSLLALAEGALAIGDFESAGEWIGAMSEAELGRRETLELRLELARVTGRDALVRQLQDELRGAADAGSDLSNIT